METIEFTEARKEFAAHLDGNRTVAEIIKILPLLNPHALREAEHFLTMATHDREDRHGIKRAEDLLAHVCDEKEARQDEARLSDD